MKFSRLLALAAAACVVSIVLAACQSRQAEPEPQASQADAPSYQPTATIKDLMLSVVDPAADVVWLSVTTVVSDKGLVETRPISDEDWTRVRHGAITLVEATNLLLMPGRRVARPGEKSETPGVELEPEEMDVLIAKDRPGWNMRVKALHDAAEAALRAVESHDADKVFELGEQIENACEGCHRQYWYPNEKVPELPAAP
jgi:hypothetical protein